MSRETWLRRILWLAALTNVSGAVLFAFPASPLGQLAGFPADVPLMYRVFCADFVLLFGGAYVWLALHRPLLRPGVVLGGVGKLSAFVLMSSLWIAGEVPQRAVMVLFADFALALGFFWGLAGVTGEGGAN